MKSRIFAPAFQTRIKQPSGSAKTGEGVGREARDRHWDRQGVIGTIKRQSSRNPPNVCGEGTRDEVLGG